MIVCNFVLIIGDSQYHYYVVNLTIKTLTYVNTLIKTTSATVDVGVVLLLAAPSVTVIPMPLAKEKPDRPSGKAKVAAAGRASTSTGVPEPAVGVEPVS